MHLVILHHCVIADVNNNPARLALCSWPQQQQHSACTRLCYYFGDKILFVYDNDVTTSGSVYKKKLNLWAMSCLVAATWTKPFWRRRRCSSSAGRRCAVQEDCIWIQLYRSEREKSPRSVGIKLLLLLLLSYLPFCCPFSAVAAHLLIPIRLDCK